MEIAAISLAALTAGWGGYSNHAVLTAPAPKKDPDPGTKVPVNGEVLSDPSTEAKVLVDPATLDDFLSPLLTLPMHQGGCGSCWSFAICKMLSDRVARKTEGEISLQLAPQRLVSCSGKMSQCTDGASTISALNWMADSGYSVSEDKYPYSVGGGGEIPKCNVDDADVRVTCEDVVTIGFIPGDPLSHWKAIQYLKASIQQFGTVIACIQIYDNLYEVTSSDEILTNAAGNFYGGHAIVVVGWHDTRKLASDQMRDVEVNNDAYWICQNSWGTSWPQDGQNGFFRIAMYGNVLDVERYCMFAEPIVLRRGAGAAQDAAQDPAVAFVEQTFNNAVAESNYNELVKNAYGFKNERLYILIGACVAFVVAVILFVVFVRKFGWDFKAGMMK
jgi:hypothetical protein